METTVTLTLSRQGIETLVRMWGISLACLKRNAKVVGAATMELAVYCSQQDKIAEATGTKSPFAEVGDILHPFLKEMLVDAKEELIQQGKDPEQILREGRLKLDIEDDDLPPFEEDGEINFN